MPAGVEPNLEATTFYDPPNFTFPFGTHIAEVEIDGETGKVAIERYTAVDDCGNVINPMIVEGQVHGGIVQSIAQALFEETVYDESGQILTGTLVDYMIPSAADLPRMDSGAHGHAVALQPARGQGHRRGGHDRGQRGVVNAAVDALSGLGIRHLEMPMQPARVWEAIQQAKAGN